MEPSELYEAALGRETKKFLVFIDLWGVTEKISKANKTKDILDIGDLVHIQSMFWSLLAVKANAYPTQIEVISASDAAYIVSDDAALLIEIVNDFMAYLSALRGNFHLIPLRAAMSSGLRQLAVNQNTLGPLQNFKFIPYIGEAFVKTYKMEKLGPKGMRFFVTESVKNAVAGKQNITVAPEKVGQVSIKSEPPEDYFEVNWLEQSSLAHKVQGTSLSANANPTYQKELERVCSAWLKHGDRYKQDVARSIFDLISWRQNGQYILPPPRKTCWLLRFLRC